MRLLARYLKTHNLTRKIVMWLTFIVASVMLMIGTGVYALTTGPKAIGDYMSDRVMAIGLLAGALVLSLALGWLLGLTLPALRYLPRLVLSALATLGGAILVFAVVVSRAILWHSPSR